MILNNVTILKQGKLIKTDVYVEEDKILYTKPGLSKEDDCDGLFLMPGLRNAHVHLGSRSLIGAGIGLNKYDYFDNIGFKSHKKRKNEDVYKASLLACYESIKQGVTHVDTMDTTLEPVIQAIESSGLSYTACLALKDHHKEAKDVNEQFNQVMKLNKKYGKKVIVGLANEYECTPHLLREGLELARELNVPIHMHACETKIEVKHIKRLTGKRTIEYLDEIGILDHDTRIAHCTYADSKEILMLANSLTPVLHCPTTNKAITDNEAPTNHLIRNEVPIMIGTDHFAWNPSASVLKEAWVSHRLTGINLLKAYSLTHKSLEEGSEANFSLVNLSELRPYRNVDEFLAKLMNNTEVEKIYIKGKEIIIKEKEIITLNNDVEKIRNKLLN